MLRFGRLVAASVLLGQAFVSEAAAPSCELTFRLGTSTPVTTASVFAIYLNAPGDFPGTATGVSCSLLNGTLGQISDGDAPQVRTLTVTTIGTPNPIQGPKNIAKCTWIPTSRFPTTGDFNLTAQSGFTSGGQQINPQITITTIECSGDITTTTTTTTTTTLAQGCGDFDNNGELQTSDALNVLKASVGQKVCALCVCDLDGNGVKAATDALVGLKSAVGVSVQLKCPACS